MLKALLLSSLTITGANTTVTSTSNILDDATECPVAMMQIIKHHNLQNHIFSKGRTYMKARSGGPLGQQVTLKVSCEPLGDK